ncbi:unnamed protein product [Ectocarpus sp. 8 AP-2014]
MLPLHTINLLQTLCGCNTSGLVPSLTCSRSFAQTLFGGVGNQPTAHFGATSKANEHGTRYTKPPVPLVGQRRQAHGERGCRVLANRKVGAKANLPTADVLCFFVCTSNQRSQHLCRLLQVQPVVTQKGSAVPLPEAPYPPLLRCFAF